MEYVSKNQMAKLDKIAPEEYGLTPSRMMENAAYQIASYVRNNYEKGSKVAVYAGKGNNGGDALATARRLHSWGFDIRLRLESELDGIREEERQILSKIGVEPVDRVNEADIAIDGIFGYNLDGEPRKPFDRMINELNTLDAVKISIDVPSGYDIESGKYRNCSVKPDTLLTLGAPFEPFADTELEHHLLDIAIPKEVYKAVGINIDPSRLFADSSRIRLL